MDEQPKKLTKNEWEVLETLFTHRLYGSVRLRIDGYDVTYEVTYLKRLTLCVMTYVNGVFKGQWIMPNNPSPEAIKFCQPKFKRLFNSKERAAFKKNLGKKEYARREFEKKGFMSYSPYWFSFSALKKHLLKNSTNIELIKN